MKDNCRKQNSDSLSIETIALAGREAASAVARAPSSQKNDALREAADALEKNRSLVMEANEKDLVNAIEVGSAMKDRLELTNGRFSDMVDGLRQVANLDDPVGAITDLKCRPSGIQVGRMRVPLGVVGIIYESRPNVTADAASLCIKSGNATILRGGKESIRSNLAIGRCISIGLKRAGLPEAVVQVLRTADRSAVSDMLRQGNLIDVIVPRGGKGLIERVKREATMPVIQHLDGVCHVYLDDHADPHKGREIALNAKTQRYGTCNTMETLLATPKSAALIFPTLLEDFFNVGVEIRGCEKTQSFHPSVIPAKEADWSEEYLGPIVAIRIVDGLSDAINHIEEYGSKHTDSIVTEHLSNARRFLSEVDSSSVMVNVSTRFADGYEYGLGAEIGISTDKFHARGPVGLEGLTSQKWVVLGEGQIRL